MVAIGCKFGNQKDDKEDKKVTVAVFHGARSEPQRENLIIEWNSMHNERAYRHVHDLNKSSSYAHLSIFAPLFQGSMSRRRDFESAWV